MIKEDFINSMIKDNVIHVKDFNVGLISNGKVTFDDLTSFILLKGLTIEFSEYINNNKDISDYIPATKVLNKELENLELPFKEEKKEVE